MAETLAQLMAPRSRADILARLLLAARGISWIRQPAAGTGTVTAGGAALTDAVVVVEILTGGEVGAATFRVSLDGGTTWSGSVVTSSSYVLGSTGVTLAFGPGATLPSFVAGDRYLFELSTPALPTTAWQAGSVPLTLMEVEAQALESFEQLAAAVAAGGYVRTATGDWLNLLAASNYDLTRRPAVRTVGTRTLRAAAGSGPHSIAVGGVWITDLSGHRYVNTTSGTLTAGGTLALTFAAESPGTAFNIAGDAPMLMTTALPGVTVDSAGSGHSWITTYGEDSEMDALLRARCTGRWSELGVGATAATYAAWALAANTGNARCKVSSDGSGGVAVLVAPVIGGASSASAAQTYIDARAPLCVTATCTDADESAVAIEGTVYVKPGTTATARAAAAAALRAYFDGAPIGGYDTGGASGVLSREKISALIASSADVIDLSLALPFEDEELGSNEWPSFDTTLADLSFVEV